MPIYKITNVGAGKCLNIHGSNVTSLVNNQNVTLWTDSGTNEQKWETTLGSIMYIKSVIDPEFALHADSSKNPCNCDVYKWRGATGRDDVVDFVASGTNYKIRLSNQTSLYLTAAGTSEGAEVIWAAAKNDNSQLWNPTATFVAGSTITETEITWLAALIFYESRGFNNYAMELVAQVVLNRVNSAKFPNSIEAVLKAPGQYGWPNSGTTATYVFNNAWVNHQEYAANQATCYAAARKVANKTSVDENGKAWPANVLYQHSFDNPNANGTGLFKTYTKGSYKLHFNFG